MTTTTITCLPPFSSENHRENNFAAPKRGLRRTWSGSASALSQTDGTGQRSSLAIMASADSFEDLGVDLGAQIFGALSDVHGSIGRYGILKDKNKPRAALRILSNQL